MKDHIMIATHKSSANTKRNSRIISFPSTLNNIKESVVCAEVLQANFLVQHNLQLLTVEHLSPLYQKMFPGSKIVKKFLCSQNETTCIVNKQFHHCSKEICKPIPSGSQMMDLVIIV